MGEKKYFSAQAISRKYVEQRIWMFNKNRVGFNDLRIQKCDLILL